MLLTSRLHEIIICKMNTIIQTFKSYNNNNNDILIIKSFFKKMVVCESKTIGKNIWVFAF